MQGFPDLRPCQVSRQGIVGAPFPHIVDSLETIYNFLNAGPVEVREDVPLVHWVEHKDLCQHIHFLPLHYILPC